MVEKEAEYLEIAFSNPCTKILLDTCKFTTHAFGGRFANSRNPLVLQRDRRLWHLFCVIGGIIVSSVAEAAAVRCSAVSVMAAIE